MSPMRRPAGARRGRKGGARAAGSSDRLLSPRPLLLAQDELLDLPGRGSRQLAELDGRGALELREVLAAERDQLVLVGVLARLELHERLRALAPLLVRHGDDRDLGDRRVAHDRLLDLDARDVLPARDDDVLGAVAQLDVAVGMPDGEVAGMKPAAAERLLGLLV